MQAGVGYAERFGWCRWRCKVQDGLGAGTEVEHDGCQSNGLPNGQTIRFKHLDVVAVVVKMAKHVFFMASHKFH